jgi:two-component system, NarL family, invasion response regulator UvrY
MRFLIVDDHKIVRLGVANILKATYPFSTIEETSNGDGVLQLIKTYDYSLIILDVNIPGTDSLSLVEQCLHIKPELKILMLSMNPEKIFSLPFIRKGASGYLEKSAEDEEIKRAVQMILDGKKYISQAVMDQMTESLGKIDHSNPFEKLSAREFEVLRHLVKGLSVGEIGEIMNLHTSTIGTHKVRIFDKLNVNNIIELKELTTLHHIN